MSVQMVQAKIKSDGVTDVEAAAKKPFAALNDAQPAGIRYALPPPAPGPGSALTPALQKRRHLRGDEVVELERLGEALAGRCVGAEDFDAFVRACLPAGEQAFAVQRGLVPGVVVHSVVVAAGSGLAFAAHEVDLLEVADGAGDSGGAHLQQLGQFGGRQAAGVGGEQRNENARGHPRHPGVRQG